MPRRVENKTTVKPTLLSRFQQTYAHMIFKKESFLARRPHRSFKISTRRDYVRKLVLPGYWSLSFAAIKLFWRHKRLFLSVLILFAVLTFLLVSIMSEQTYVQLRELVQSSNEEGSVSGFVETTSLFWGILTTQLIGASGSVTNSSQQVVGLLLGLYCWLTVLWLARAIMAGKKPTLRDGLYSSGSPVMALLGLSFMLVIQALPAAIAVILYGAADASGLLSQTAALMLAGGATILVIVLSLYWMTSTFFAMIIVTLPGMYPLRAMRLSGDIVTSRRIRVLLRLLWLVALILAIWLAVLMPVIVIDGALKNAIPAISWLPIVPLTGLLLASFSLVFSALYIYIFYRRVVEDDTNSV